MIRGSPSRGEGGVVWITTEPDADGLGLGRHHRREEVEEMAAQRSAEMAP